MVIVLLGLLVYWGPVMWKWKLEAEVPERLISMEAEAAKVAEAEAEASKCWKQKRKYYMRERRLKAEAPEVTIFFMEAANVEWMEAETEAVNKIWKAKGKRERTYWKGKRVDVKMEAEVGLG